MTEEEQVVEAPGALEDLDLLPGGGWAATVGLPQPGPTTRHMVVFHTGETVELAPSIRFPANRAISTHDVVIVGRRRNAVGGAEARNGWIVRRSGDVVAGFDAGDAIEDIVVTRAGIAVTYFDEGVFGDHPLGREGVVLFGFDGSLRWGYHSRFADDAVDVADCYAASATESGQLLFLPSQDFPLVCVNVMNATQKINRTPVPLHAASAISLLGDKLFVFNPYNQRDVLLKWLIGTEAIQTIGAYERPGCVRGLPGGRFLAIRADGYSVLTLGAKARDGES